MSEISYQRCHMATGTVLVPYRSDYVFSHINEISAQKRVLCECTARPYQYWNFFDFSYTKKTLCATNKEHLGWIKDPTFSSSSLRSIISSKFLYVPRQNTLYKPSNNNLPIRIRTSCRHQIKELKRLWHCLSMSYFHIFRWDRTMTIIYNFLRFGNFVILIVNFFT